MKLAVKIIAILSLLLLIVPSFLFLGGRIELTTVKGLMSAASVIWFVSAGMWMWKEKQS